MKTTLRGVALLAAHPQRRIEQASDQPIALAVAVGDDGVVLERSAEGNWIRQPTGTHESLAAWCFRRVVGAHGTVLKDGSSDVADTTNDLLACYAQFAVGVSGTIVERKHGPNQRWTTVPSGTASDLLALWEGGTNCAHAPQDPPPLASVRAFGRGGTIVRCTFAMCWPDARPTTCEGIPSPTTADLHAFGMFMDRVPGGARRAIPFVVGARGTLIRAEGDDDSHWTSTTTGLTENLRAVAVNHSFGNDATGVPVIHDPLVVGDHCTAAFLHGLDGRSNVTAQPIQLDCRVDLFGAAADGLHVFLVGGEGTIWHGTIDGITIPELHIVLQ